MKLELFLCQYLSHIMLQREVLHYFHAVCLASSLLYKGMAMQLLIDRRRNDIIREIMKGGETITDKIEAK